MQCPARRVICSFEKFSKTAPKFHNVSHHTPYNIQFGGNMRLPTIFNEFVLEFQISFLFLNRPMSSLRGSGITKNGQNRALFAPAPFAGYAERKKERVNFYDANYIIWQSFVKIGPRISENARLELLVLKPICTPRVFAGYFNFHSNALYKSIYLLTYLLTYWYNSKLRVETSFVLISYSYTLYYLRQEVLRSVVFVCLFVGSFIGVFVCSLLRISLPAALDGGSAVAAGVVGGRRCA